LVFDKILISSASGDSAGYRYVYRCAKTDKTPVATQTGDETSDEVYTIRTPNKKTITMLPFVRFRSNVSFEYYNYGPIYKMWVDEVTKQAASESRNMETASLQLN
jgi:hypothetical protein